MSDGKTGDAAVREFRTRMIKAIVSTNLLGMPVQVIFIAAVLGITFLNFAEEMQIDPWFIPFNFFLLSALLFIFVGIHFVHVTGRSKPLLDYLSRGRKARPEERQALAEAALKTTETLPYDIMRWSIIYYATGTMVAVLALQIAYSFTWVQSLGLYIGVTAIGSLISVFQYYTSRQLLMSYQAELLEDFPDLIVNGGQQEKIRFGLREKFMGAMTLLAVVLVILSGVISISSTIMGLQFQLGLFYQSRLQEDARSIEKTLEAGIPPSEIQKFLEVIHPDRRDTMILVDPEINNLLERPLAPEQKLLAQIILGRFKKLAFQRPAVHNLAENLYSAVIGGEMAAVVHVPMKNAHLFVLAPASHHDSVVSGINMMMAVAIGIACLLAVVYARFSSDEIRRPLASLMSVVGDMAHGDLSRNVTVTGKDEIGLMAGSLATAIFSLRRLIGRVGEAAAAVDSAAYEIDGKSGDVAGGSGSQVASVTDAAGSVEQMREAVRSIAESVQTLASSAEESSASMIEVQATIEEVGGSVENLSVAIEQTTTSIQEMNASIKEVADNVQQLTRRSSDAMGSLSEMERMIQRVTQGSRETSAITSQVTADAEQGAQAVKVTISGIDKIKSTSEGVAEVIGRLGRRAREIGNILTMINDVTEETNLLALNAAIIAAQAGEHGRGFSVVADEIKDLAERTAASTSEIATLINTVQEDAKKAVERMREGMNTISEGVRLSQEGGRALDKIQQSVKKAMEQTKSIADAATVQAEKSRQVMDFMEGLNALIMQVAQATQEQSRSGDQIADAALRMEEIARKVKIATQEQTQGSKQVTQAIEHIADITHYINNSQSDQVRSADRMSGAIGRIGEIAETNRERVNSMTDTVQNLKRLAEDLRNLLSQFKL